MGRWVRISLVSSSLLAAGLTVQLAANAHTFRVNRASFAHKIESKSVGHAGVPQAGPHLGSSGSTVLADAYGLVVAERNAGALVRADRNGQPTATLALHEGLGQIVHDGRGQLFVADSRGDRVVSVDPETFTAAGEIAIREPHGLALSPDGKTLYVTSIAEHELVAIDTASSKIEWRVSLTAEPRGVAVSADGKEAVVGFLSSGALAVVDLASAGEQVRWRTLNPRDHVEIEQEEDDWGEGEIDVAVVREMRSRFEVPSNQGRRSARNVFNVAYMGHGLVAAPHQLSTPQMKRVPSSEVEDSYGGGPQQVPAIIHRLAVLDGANTNATRTAFSTLALHQPRALTYDAASDTLYLAGYGDDRVAALRAASQPEPYIEWIANPKLNTGKRACGPDGLAVDGDAVWVHCELGRRLVRLTPGQFDLDDKEWKAEKAGVLEGPELAASLRSEEVEAGAELFRRGGDWRISASGVMACASCHPDGRQDGLTWRLGKSILQTPMLAGRIAGTAPYKWSGEDANLTASFKHTVERLGGSRDDMRSSELDAMAAYVQALPLPRPPTPKDATAIARGKKLFEGSLACTACHVGDKLTDGSQYPFTARGLDVTDTPSLIGLAHTAPYYHDGSAGDLYTLLTDKGTVHDMADLSGLERAQIDDLTAFLQSL